MKPVTFIVGLLLALLLFTRQGQTISELALGAMVSKGQPAPVDEAANQKWCAAHPAEHAYHYPVCRP